MSRADSGDEDGELDSIDAEFRQLTESLEPPVSDDLDEELADFDLHLDSTVLCNVVVAAPVPFVMMQGIAEHVNLRQQSNAPVPGLGKDGVIPVDFRHSSGLFMQIQRDPNKDEELEMAALLGEERPMPEAVDVIASSMAVNGLTVVALAAWLAEDADPNEAGISGFITARQYENGQPGEFLPGGLVVTQMGKRLEDLLLGAVNPEDMRGSFWNLFGRRHDDED